MNSWEKELLSDCLKELLEAGVQVELRPEAGIFHAGGECSGWYEDGSDGSKRALVVSCGRPDWIEVFAHEYCHFTQDKDGMFAELDEDKLWEWLEGKELSEEELDRAVSESRELEADNERRTVELLKKYAVPVDLDHYARKCNAYILFYNTVRRDRKWSSEGKPRPYDVPEILEKMEGKILDDFTDGPEWDWFHDLVREYCYE